MKKYLNKNIFFQGDAKIFSVLMSLLLLVGVFLDITMNNSNYNDYRFMLYNYSDQVKNPLGIVGMFILVVFLVICFVLICGMFKRKKWATLLSGPFSRIDIRKRELTLMIGCIMGFILLFLLVCERNYIANDVLNSYIKGFWILVVIDIIRIVVVSAALTSILFFIDSLTSNMYVTLGSMFAIGAYCIVVIITIGSSFLWAYNSIVRKIWEYITIMIDSILFGAEINIHKYLFFTGLILLIIITIVCTIITKKLTEKIKVENMGDALIFRSIRKIAPILLSTLIGMIVGTIIFKGLLVDNRLEVVLNTVTYPLISIGIITIISILIYIIIKSISTVLKNKIPGKYI
ncbi:hypothetical protein [Clostridium gasigenes]|uniref:Uncharacterized protein n=1 Tax=Clostridium gasigenes TaxID=94869 RepID=A0A1H0N994_9CLOT|nr:hypothetical protein [Clostridium gasigenes]MBB6623865.1 hypothetical protein [Clostridium gasigenes]MBU3087411.1 hypothetical protein [Clostridium gasigenes]SDO89238.1 hypothetical protein SAMN04488529_101745 [Clostridium gasigenes]